MPVAVNNPKTPGRVTILTHFDAGASGARHVFPAEKKPVRIEPGAYVGACALIMPGVTVGAGGIVAAGAVVTRDVEPGYIVAGVPARPLRDTRVSARHRGRSPGE